MQNQVKQLTQKPPVWRDLLMLAVIVGILYSFFLGSRPLSVPDEARYVEIPREMLVTADFITPRLNFINYFEKPPFFYWMQTLPMKYLGTSESSLRLMTCLMGIFGCLFTFVAAEKLFHRRIAWMSALILSSSMLYYALSHLITLDMTLSTWMCSALFSFLIATQERNPVTRRRFMWATAVFSAFAVLTKGLVGILLPCIIIFLWLTFTNQWRLLKTLFIPSSLLLFLIITLPWHIAIQYRNPEFFYFYFVTQQFSRYLTMSAHRYQPVWFFIPIIVLGFFPWVGFLFQALFHAGKDVIKNCKTHAITTFLLVWATVIFLFFSLSHSKLIPYIVPIFPPLAIIIALYLSNNHYRRGIKIGFIISTVISILLAIALLFIPRFYPVPYPALVTRDMITFAIPLITGSVLSLALYCLLSFRAGFIALTITAFISFSAAMPAIPHIDHHSIKRLAAMIKPQLTADDVVVSYRHYYQDLPFYLERRVVTVDWKNELEFGAGYQADAADWMLDTPRFIALWKSSKTVYMVTRLKYYDILLKEYPSLHFYVIGRTFESVLTSNREIAK